MKLRFPISLPRRDDGTLLPALLFALLAAAIVSQLAATGEPDLPQAGVGRVARADLAFAAPPPTAGIGIMTHPLFSPTRSGDARSIHDSNTAGPLGGAVVVGIVARGRSARLFLKAPDGSIHTLAPGGSYLGWRLTGLSDDAARFAMAGERISVNFGSQAAAPTSEADASSEEE